jgi:putative multicomponent Na+:H+ antiporter subunit B
MDSYIYVITALLPLAASMLVFQTNPYHALVIRGIMGAISALVYTILGAADVGLTDALVGTLLAVTLYAIAVRSSLVLRLGVLKDEVLPEIAVSGDTDDLYSSHFRPLLEDLRAIFGKRHMRVELVPYLEREDLHRH